MLQHVSVFEGELLSSAETFSNGLQLTDLILAFSASIDSLAWIILLLVFELETSILSDESIKGRFKWPLLLVKTFCYLFIIYAAYGYIARLFVLLDVSVFQIADVCTLIGSSYTYVVSLDEYLPITESVCQLMNNNTLVLINGTEIIATDEALTAAQYLGWVDIINSTNWLIIVFILEFDVYLQLRGRLVGMTNKVRWTKKTKMTMK